MTPIQELSHSLRITISRNDSKRLAPHLSGWNHLNEILLLGQITTHDLKRMVLIEVTGLGRRDIIRKLVARLKRQEARQLLAHIDLCLKNK